MPAEVYLLQSAGLPPVTVNMLVVSAIALGAFVLFASEVVRVDVAALIVISR